MRCPRCQQDDPPQSTFCLECGTRLALACASCGAELPAGAKFCSRCGSPIGTGSFQSRFTSPEAYTPRHYETRLFPDLEYTFPLLAHCGLGLGKLYSRAGDRAKAREHLTTAATMYREMDMGFWLAQVEAPLAPPG